MKIKKPTPEQRIIHCSATMIHILEEVEQAAFSGKAHPHAVGVAENQKIITPGSVPRVVLGAIIIPIGILKELRLALNALEVKSTNKKAKEN